MESKGLLALIMLLLPLTVCGMISLAIRTPVTAPPKTPTDWPPFTMEYREEGHVHVITRAEPGFQRYQFIFNTPTDWKHTITDSTQKAFIGSYKQYMGVSLIDFDASSNYTTTTDTSNDDPYIPDQWLSIGYIKGLQQMPNVTKEETDDPTLGKLIETGESPCDEADPSLTNCKPGQKVRTGSREITYRLDTLIPVLVVDKVEGETVYTATVEKLEFR